MLYLYRIFKAFCFGLLSLCASAALAVEAYPLQYLYLDLDSATQQDEWDYMMKFKMLGITGIEFGNKDIKVPDESGWFGTATGDWIDEGNGGNKVGGPIVLGGNMRLGMGPDTVLTGPVHVLGNVTVSSPTNFESKENRIYGLQCIEKTAAPSYSKIIAPENQYFGTACPSNVPKVNTGIKIPTLDYAGTYGPGIDINGADDPSNVQTKYIHVPKGTGPYDIYLDHISFSNKARLEIRMPYGGRLTRVFLYRGFTSMAAGCKIQVRYMDRDETLAEFKNGEWTGKGEIVANKDYGGNLLFYTTEDITFPSFSQGEVDGKLVGLDTLQGTFISAGKITIGHHTVLAGQLLSNYLKVDTDFDGSGFRYVPFDPPVLDPKLFTTLDFKENDEITVVPVALSKQTKVQVSFRYCFDLSKFEPVDGMTDDRKADLTDFDLVDPEDPDYHMYICGIDTGKVVILENDSLPTKESQIRIKVKLDPYLEVYSGRNIKEILRLQVDSLQGAVMEDNSRDGFFDLNIIDVNVVPVTKDTLVTVAEDDTLRFDKDMFPYFSLINSEWTGVAIDAVPSSGSFTYFGKEVAVGQIIPVDSLPKLEYFAGENEFGAAKDDNTYSTFKFSVVDANGGKSSTDKNEGSKIMDVKVTPVNDAPESKNTTFAVKARNESADTLRGTIKVTDVDDPEHLFVLDSSDANFKVIDSLFTFDPSSGTMTIREGITLECGPEGIEYPIKVTISDKAASTGNKEDIKSTVITLTVAVLYDNNAPTLDPSKPSVSENTKPGVVVDTLKGSDKDKRDSVLTFELVKENPFFDVSESGVITVKEGAKLDYETEKSVTIKVRVCDLYECDTSDVTISVTDVNFKIVEVDETKYPENCWSRLGTSSCAPMRDTVFTNKPDVSLYCSLNSAKEDLCADTTLVDGCHHIVQSSPESDLLFGGELSDSIWVCVSTQTPEVTISLVGNNPKAGNIFTVVEDAKDLGTDVFVNKVENWLKFTVRDSLTGVKFEDSTKISLEAVKVPDETFKKMNAVVESGVKLDENAPGAVSTPTNEGYRVTYTTTGKDGVEITVSYDKKDNGDVIETTVINEDGKEEKRELVTVSYTTKVDGKEVVLSYQADASTGLPVYMTSNGKLSFNDRDADEGGLFSVAIPQKDANAQVSYSVDKDGNLVKNESGDIGYTVSYTYVNKPYGNVAVQSIFVILDQVGPKVEILTPVDGITVSANFVDVVWTVNGEKQDTLNVQGLEKGVNAIVRFYKDKAGNMSSDTVFIVMKDGKDVDVAVERPVTKVTQDKVDEYYASNPPEKGQTFAVSIRNPKTSKEVETLKGGSFGDKPGSGKEPYPGVSSSKHLGPTLTMDIKLPVVNAVGGLATLDDLVGSDGMVSLDGVDAANSKKVSVDEYVSTYCDADVKTTDISRVNLYNAKMDVKVWIYTTLGGFVDYYRFTQEMNNPDYTDDAGMLKMFFEQKPDKHGNVRDESGRLYATGAYLYKVEAQIRSELRCTLPPVSDESGKKKGDVIKSNDSLLKPFGYRRPEMGR